MGILNLTPDSFSDGGSYQQPEVAIARARHMWSQGATIIDIGAVSTRPGAATISVDEELARLVPVVSALRKQIPEMIISIDTWRAAVAYEMIHHYGIHIINDISGGSFEPEILTVVGNAKNIPYILMHTPGSPAIMQQLTDNYTDLLTDISTFFVKQLQQAAAAGIVDIILDPGFGFGKTLAQNYELVRQFSAFTAFQKPLLVGISRKSMLTKLPGINTISNAANDSADLFPLTDAPINRNIAQSAHLAPACALHLKLLEAGARILRVHDVTAAVAVIRLFEYLYC